MVQWKPRGSRGAENGVVAFGKENIDLGQHDFRISWIKTEKAMHREITIYLAAALVRVGFFCGLKAVMVSSCRVPQVWVWTVQLIGMVCGSLQEIEKK